MYESGNIGFNKESISAGGEVEYLIAGALYQAGFDAETAHGAGYQAYQGFVTAEALEAQAAATGDPATAARAANARTEAEEFRNKASTNAGSCIEKLGGCILLSTAAISHFSEAVDEHSTGAQIKTDAYQQGDDLIDLTAKVNGAANTLPTVEGVPLLEAANLLGDSAGDIQTQQQKALGIASLAHDYYNTQ